jgi:acyl transferase domain-containing protein
MAKTTPPAGAEPIAITGIGCRFPGGARDADSFWQQLRSGTDAIIEITPDRWNLRRYFDEEPGKPGKTYSKWAALIDGIDLFDPAFFGLTPREAAVIDPQQRLLLEATWAALEDAGQPIDLTNGSNVGVFVGVSTTDYALIQTTGDDIASLDGYSTTGTTMSLAANRISYCFNFLGPSVPVDTACSSSLIAVHLAVSALRNRECEMAVAAGVNVIAGACPFIAFSSMAMLSPDGRCKSFDADANGFVRGEGVGAILLKPLSAALAAGDPIYAVIRATGSNQDGHTPGITVPSQRAQETLVRQACREAGVAPAAVQYVEAHGTGTPVGDPIETNALGSVLREGRDADNPCLIGSVKTNIGHLEAAAGIAGIIKAALVLKHGQVPPNLHFRKANPQIDFDRLKLRVPQELTPLRSGRQRPLACVNSFGWGGANAHALLEAPPVRAKPPRAEHRKGVQLLPLSARSPEGLTALARTYADFLRQPKTPALRDICYSSATRRTHLEHRIAFTGRTKQELASKLDEFARGESRQSTQQPRPGRKIAFVFSGQGPQWWRMGRDLLEREPVFRAKVEECDGMLREIGDWSLLEELTKDESASRLDHTGYAQPAIFALQVALADLWKSWNVTPDAVVGHSVGEVAAAHVAGALDLREAIRVIYHRGDTMEHVTTEGRMLAAGLTLREAEAAVAKHPGAVFLAAVNSPSSVTLSGEESALTAVFDELTERQVFARFVPVRYAFHSAQMDPVEPELRKALNGLAPQAATIPIASTVTGGIAPGSLFDADYWWRNVRDTVQFADAISALLDAGCDTFLELGPHPVLGISIRECLDQRGERGTVLASLQRGADDQSAMLETLGVLHGMGHSVDWQALFPGGAQYVRLPPHPLQRERYWNEPEASRALRLSAPSHPFLDRRIPCADPCWEVKLDRRSFPYLSDHRIQGRALFPAAGFLEMALASAREMFGPGGYVLENVDLLNALFLPETDHPPTLQLTYHGADSSFVISSSTQPGSGNWTRHVTGRMRPMGAIELPVPCPLADMRERCSTNMPTDAFYKLLYEGGLQYGPTFRGVTHVWRRELEAVAQLALPERLAGQFESYLIHPAYLDACFQPGFLALPSGRFTDEAGVFLPVHVERMQFFSSPDATGWVHGDITRCGSRSCDSDIQLTGPDGQVHVRFTGFRWLLVEGTHREQDDWLFELRWHLKPLVSQSWETFVPSCAPIATDCSLKPCVGWALPTEGSCGELGEGNKIHASPSLLALNPPPAQEAASLGNACGLVGGAHPTIGSGEQSGALGGHRSFPRGDGLTQRPPDVRGATNGNLADLAEFMSREAARLRSSATWPVNRKTMDAQMNELCASYALPALAALGWQPQTGETVKLARLLESLRLPLGAAGRLQTLLMLLQSAGMLERHGNSDAWTVASRSTPRRPKELWQSILPGSPGLAPALILAERVGTGIAGLLHGTADPYAVLFPHGSNAALDQLRSDWPAFRLADRLLAETVAHLAAGQPEGHRLRILEIGSGVGAATARILPVLRPERFDYLYTDVSDRFFADVQKRIQDFPSVSCQTLDLESDPASQDLNPGSFDLILVANGFGTFEWAPESLTKVRGLLAPGGLLLLTEAIRTPPWLTFLMSILRPSGSEAVPAIRRRQLEAAGFAEVRALKDAELGAVLALAPPAAAIPNAEPMGAFRRWLLLIDEIGCGEALMMQLRRRGHECKAIRKAEWARNPDAVRRAWTEFAAGSGAKGIVHLWSLDIPEAETLDADSLMDAQPSGCLGVLELVQAMTATQVAEMPLLWLVTRGAQPAGDGVQPIAMGQTPLIGLGRVIRTEHPDLPCRSVDLDPAHAICDIDGLLAELFANEQEDEVALRGKARYVQRVGHGALDAAVRGAPHRVDPHEHPCRLEIPKPGLLDRLRLMPLQRRTPDPDEVEIEVAAAGLNFRDVMKTLGIYPTDADDATVLGDECAGRVIAVGERVRDFAVGDEVMAIAPGCFASHVTIHAALVLPRPPRLSQEEAATMLVAYLTAYYALHHLAHLRAGERVLIHSAAGGVGFAAVQLARRAGAEIFATAGSPEKRDFLGACGVEHVIDSRSLAFVDEIMERTGRQGVDVVLNSLAGEFIPQSLSLLGPGGRFLEIGKRDIYQDSKLGLRPFRHNLSFFAVDLSRAMHPDFIREFTTRLRSEFRSGRLSPLPYRCFSIGEAVNAFRYMAQARQIGKIVLTVRDERVSLAPRQDKSRAEFHRDGSYLITGGLSGFGLAVAQWMAVKGARHLVLMSRSGVATMRPARPWRCCAMPASKSSSQPAT